LTFFFDLAKIEPDRKDKEKFMEASKRREKIVQSATARRLRVLIVFSAGLAAVFFLLFVLFAALWRERTGKVLAAFSFLFFAALCAWSCMFAFGLIKIKKEAGRYAFTVTETSSFECFGPFLAMNVSFFDRKGNLREGRSRFLFGARDVEAWQNVPLEIAYLDPDCFVRSETLRRKKKKRKPDLQPDAGIIVIGAAPGRKI